MKYALIGCGRIAPNHITAYIGNRDQLELCGVSDVVPERMDELLERLPEAERAGIRRYHDYHELLKTERPELVAIATESGKHAAIALDCIESGANVIIEKPIALSIADADRIIDAASRAGVVACACHQNRFNKSIQKIREAMETGRFGKLLHGAAHIRWNRGHGYYDHATWRGTWAEDGGCMMNQCIHDVDLLRWMMGDEVDEVFAYTDRLNHPYIEAEDLGMALVRFKNGAYGIIEGTTNVCPSNLEETLYIFGETGTVKAGGLSVNNIEEWAFADLADDPAEIKRKHNESPDDVYGFGHTPLYTDVIRAIKTGSKPYVDAEAGKRALELILAMYKSAQLGQPVKLPLKDVSTLDFTGRFDS